MTDTDRQGVRATRTDAGKSLSEQAYEELRDRLVTLRIAPGAAISEDQLMLEMGMGRTPIREAVKRLALERLVTIYPRRGTFASDVHIMDLALIADVRIVLEGHAAARAAERLQPADRDDLDALLDDLDRLGSPATQDAVMQLDSRVHRFMYRVSRNPYLESALQQHYALSLRLWYVVIDRLPHLVHSIQEHREILEAIRDGDAAGAREFAARHVRAFEEKVRSVI
jgi:DNA-binding GntR family transcriptional regulator